MACGCSAAAQKTRDHTTHERGLTIMSDIEKLIEGQDETVTLPFEVGRMELILEGLRGASVEELNIAAVLIGRLLGDIQRKAEAKVAVDELIVRMKARKQAGSDKVDPTDDPSLMHYMNKTDEELAS